MPLADGARLTLLHAIPERLPARARQRAERDAGKALEAEARDLARRLHKRVSIQCVVKVGAAPAEIARCASAASAELLVMGRGGGRALRDLYLGSTAERVIRRGRLPVLVVRLPAHAPYRHPAVALDLDQAAHSVLELLLRVIPPPRPSVEIVHAYDIPYHGKIYPSLSEDDAEEYREHHRDKVLRKIGELLSTSLAQAKVSPVDAPSWRTHVGFGSARTFIKRAVRKGDADLLVLGTHGHSGVAHAFLGTVAGDVLREVACDVLVVPPRHA